MSTKTRERPILFSGPMVRAILDGRKTQTRRVLTPQPEAGPLACAPDVEFTQILPCQYTGRWMRCGAKGQCCCGSEKGWGGPYGWTGDRLWVRETWGPVSATEDYPGPPDRPYRDHQDRPAKGGGIWVADWVIYRADGEDFGEKSSWHPSIHMPRWASRLTLEVVDVRVERVQEISEDDAVAEGCVPQPDDCPQCPDVCSAHQPASGQFRTLWDSINGDRRDPKTKERLPYAWDDNPWVWVVEFKAV